MAQKKTMTSDDFKKYEEVVPLSNHLLIEVIDKADTRLLDSGLLLQEESVTNTKPYLAVRKISKQVEGVANDIAVGDIVETMGGHINFFYGQNLERFALVPIHNVAGVYKKRA